MTRFLFCGRTDDDDNDARDMLVDADANDS
jgi:hypothetical protein